MSSMEVFYGKYGKSNEKIIPEDADDFYDLEEKNNCHYVMVDGQLYWFYKLEEVDAYGFSLVIEPSEEKRFICMWYNGGAGIHEVAEEAIRKAELSDD